MKRFFVLISILFISLGVFSQRVDFGYNKSTGVSFGYSHIYTKSPIGLPTNMASVDLTVFGVYAGFAYGEETLYREYAGYDTYSEKLNRYIMRVGPSFKLGTYNSGISITPYIGMMIDTYSENISDTYYDYYYNYYEKYDHTLWEESLDYSFVYGVRLGLQLNLFEIGAHISNKEFGVTVGFSVDMSY
jgi:hypothetical protein